MYIDISPNNNTYHNAYTYVLTDNRFTFYTTHYFTYIYCIIRHLGHIYVFGRDLRPSCILKLHVDSNWPEFTFVFTYISCLNRLALSAISLKTNSLSYLILFIISLVSIHKKGESFGLNFQIFI